MIFPLLQGCGDRNGFLPFGPTGHVPAPRAKSNALNSVNHVCTEEVVLSSLPLLSGSEESSFI